MSVPRVATLLGKPLDRADYAAWQRLVEAHTAEAFDLDFKKAHYVKERAEEFAKDVAAFANTQGGVIVIGVEEENRVSTEMSPVVFDQDLEQQMERWVANNVFPRPAWRSHRVLDPVDASKGLLICIVPPSRLAPHALYLSGDRTNPTLRYPTRRNADTFLMAEHEVAERYRQRFVRGKESEERLQVVLREALDGWRASAAHITAALVPLEPGDIPVSAALVQEVQRLSRAPGGVLSNANVVTGFRRLRLRDRASLQSHMQQRFYAELHSDGAAVVSVPLLNRQRGDLLITTQAGLVLLAGEALRELLRHADRAGCVGDALLVLRIVLDAPTKAQLRLEPLAQWHPSSDQDLMPATGSLESRHTIALQQLPQEDMLVLRSVLTDWVQSFGVPETDLISAAGTIDAGRWKQVVGEDPDDTNRRWGSFPPEVIRR